MKGEQSRVEVGGIRFRVLRTRDEIAADVRRMALELRGRAGDRVPVFIGLLKGSFVLLADLIRAYDGPHEIDFMTLTRFDPALKDSTTVRVLHDLSLGVKDRLVIVVEGIHTSRTKTEYVDLFLRLHGPEEILHCALIQQKASAGGAVSLDSRGFFVDDEYVVGYGLDQDERYRHLPFVGVIEDRDGPGRAG